jgi:hypothetical protein
MTTLRIQELESLGFEWGVVYGAAWEDRLSELADYRKIHGNCNVPRNYSENIKLGHWVAYQRYQYKLHLEGKRLCMQLSRIQALESLGFEWKGPMSRRKGTPQKPSLDDDAEWRPSMNRRKVTRTKPSLDDDAEWKPSISREKGTPKKPRRGRDSRSREGRGGTRA